jgi:hypothetical protein
MTTHRLTSFADLQALHLHELGEVGWRDYYPAMAAYVADGDPAIRSVAVERLTSALVWAEESAERQARKDGRGWDLRQEARLAWLIEALETAHTRYADILPAFLKVLSVRGEGWILMKPLRDWLHRLAAAPPPGVDPHKVEAALLRLATFDEESAEDKARLIALLDHAAAAVRASAAHRLSAFADDDIGLFDLIKHKELARPGIAGPFWTEFHFDSQYRPIDPIPWMMDVLERRSGPEPSLDEMGYNGVDFYLHEVCGGSPKAVRRMIDDGHLALAIETATEMLCVMPGMEPLLIELGQHTDQGIARRARLQLAMFYRVLHPGITDGSIRMRPDWAADAETFSFHWGEDNTLWFIVLYPRLGPDFDDTSAWALIDRALPPDLRGAVVRHMLDGRNEDAPGAYDLPGSRRVQFASGANLTLEGDVANGRWRRIEIIGHKLAPRWAPFAT